MKPNIGKLLLLSLALLIMFVPELAFAQAGGSDKSREWFIKGLFGGLDGGGGDPLVGIVGVFNAAVLMVGGVLLAYTLIAGSMQTASDGEMLGKRWSSLWLPIRTSLGVAAILPAINGYAIIQAAVIWLAIQGIDIANQMTEKFLAQATTQNNTYTFSAANIKPEIVSISKQLVMNSACVAAFDDDLNANDDSSKNVFGINFAPGMGMFNLSGVIDGATQGFSADGISSFMPYRYGCGTVAFPAKSVSSNHDQLQILDLQKLSEIRSEMWDVNNAQFQAALQKSSSMGISIAQAARAGSDEEEVKKQIMKGANEIADAWSQAIVSAATGKSENLVNQKLVSQINSDGWILLGSWYMQITLAQQALSETMVITPEVALPDAIIEGARVQTQGGGTIEKLAGGVIRWATGQKAYIGQDAASTLMYAVRVTDGGSGDNATQMAGTNSPKGILYSITRKLTVAFTGLDLSGSDKNPVVLATEVGSRLTTSVGIAIVVFAVAAGMAGTGATIGTNIVLVAVSILSPLLITMLGTGLTLSYYIPMVPYILWLGAVFGWVVLIVEAVIAAPLWAVTHLAPDGDGVVGRGGQGYMLVLSLTLRPGLMVFGFAAAVAVMNPMGKFLNETFMGTFFASVSPGMTGLFKILAGTVIYCTLMLTIINRVFSLIHQVPDGILRWIGGGDNVIGREANETSSGAGKAIAAGTAAAGAMGAISNAGREIGATARQNKLAADQRKNALAGTAAQQAGNAEDVASRSMRDAGNRLDSLGDAVGSSSFDQQADGVQRQTDASALASVSSLEKAAKSVLASDAAADKNDPLRPSANDVSAAKNILDQLKSDEGQAAMKDPNAARQFINDNLGKFSGSKFDAQLHNASGGISAMDGKLSQMRENHNNALQERADKQAVSMVGGIHEKASSIIDRASTLSEGDPDMPSANELSAAKDVVSSIESSGALKDGASARDWLNNSSSKHEGTELGNDISMAAARASRNKPNNAGDGLNG